ncbi:protein kinase [Flavobacterium sp. CSZ]|uniref:protein kinase domain-containing protein n=1 Tax=Flavobacterium sp. CSZ TaxID=2783791 RepID=UPI00188BBD94|nr:protein kinase [Flavobacterium sp. CSZ]MBF4487744.1 protein kinase [Flavobacterium sp. CSZ]
MKVTEVIKVINDTGGFGIIEEVKCNDGNNYARKTFNPSFSFPAGSDLNDKLRNRFIREVKTQKLLPEELFVPIVFEDLTSKRPWFLMPICDNVFTEEIILSKNEARLPDGLSDILNSLEFIHSKGLVHRDLKPQNILLHEGVWKLADFGLISQDKEILSQSITTSNNAFGTAMYCSPEQTTDFKRVKASADIYSFGAILHDIFTDGKRVPYSELKGDGEIGIIISMCTRNNPEKRFKDINSLREKLLYILSKDIAIKTTADTEAWITALKDIENLNADKFENLIFFLKRNEDLVHPILYELNNNIINKFHELDKELFNEFSLIYFDWIIKTSYLFDFCDVLIGYIRKISEKTDDLEIKARAVIASAELGRSHNRWYVMKRVIRMSDEEINDDLAFRISLEIELDNQNKINFKRCAEGINLSITSYHPTIKNALEN